MLFAAWLLPGLLGHDPWKPDEAYSFGIVYQMLESGDWVVPAVAGEPFLEKPPLFYATAAALAHAFGSWLPLHDAARLASGAYVAATLLFVALTAATLYGKRAAVPAVLLLMGCLGFVPPAHQLITDNALVTGFAMALFGLALTPARPHAAGMLLGSGAGIAFFAKGLFGPGAIALTAIALRLLPMGRGRTYRRSLGWAVAAFLPWALIWPWLLHARSPELLEEWIWLNNIGRFTGDAALGPERDHWMYLRILLVFSFPALPLALWSLWHADGPGRPGLSDPGIALPLVLFGVSFLILSSSSSSRNIYALPLLVPLCLLAVADAGSLTSWIARALDAAVRWAASALAVLMWAAWLAFMVGWPPLTARLLAAHPGFQPQVVAVPLLAALALSAGWLFLLYRREKGGMPFLWTGGVALVWGLAMTLWLPYLDHAKSYRAVMSELRRHLPADSCVASVGLRESQLAMLHYFAGVVPVRHGTQAAEACSYVLVEGSGRFGKLLWSGSRSGDSAERFALYTVRPKP